MFEVRVAIWQDETLKSSVQVTLTYRHVVYPISAVNLDVHLDSYWFYGIK